MLEAKALGFALPDAFFNNWVSFQTNQANTWVYTASRNSYYSYYYYDNNELIQAYRLFTLALAQKPAWGAMNRMREIKTLCAKAKWRLAAAYALAGKPEIAEELIQ